MIVIPPAIAIYQYIPIDMTAGYRLGSDVSLPEHCKTAIYQSMFNISFLDEAPREGGGHASNLPS